jgi:hypothetical protein
LASSEDDHEHDRNPKGCGFHGLSPFLLRTKLVLVSL